MALSYAQETVLRARCTAAGLDFDAEVARIHEADAKGLCRECETAPRQIGYVCAGCHGKRLAELDREAAAVAREQRRAESTRYREQATAAGIVVGARVTRKRGRGNGTVIEVGGNYVRVAWHDSWGRPGWGRGGSDHRTYITSLAALKVLP